MRGRTGNGECPKLLGPWVVVQGMLAVCAGIDVQAAEPSLGLSGCETSIWAYQLRESTLDAAEQDASDASAGPLFYVAWHLPGVSGSTWLRKPLNVDAIHGTPVHSVARADSLHVIYADGTHVRYDTLNASTEVNLPDNAVPLALGVDEPLDELVAIIATSSATKLPVRNEPDAVADADNQGHDGAADNGNIEHSEAESQTAKSVTGDSSAPAAVIGAMPDNPPFSVVRYVDGQWIFDRFAPVAVSRVDRVSIAAWNGRTWILLVGGSTALATVFVSEGDDWEAFSIGEQHHIDHLLAIAGYENGLRIILPGAIGENGDAVAASVWSFKNRAFEHQATLTGNEAPVAATFAGMRVVLGFLHENEQAWVGYWPIDGGDAEVAPKPVDALAPRVVPWTRHWMTVIAYVILTSLLMGVFWLRRESMMQPVPIGPGFKLAGHARRLAAFLIDVIINAPVAGGIFWMALPGGDGDVFARREMELAIRNLSPEYLVGWLLATLAMIVYFTAFEATIGATPGKRICRCGVLNEFGDKCSFRAVLLRNLLRLVEFFPLFELMPALVLIILTRNRQRLGDLIARTVVVEQTSLADAAQQQQRPREDSGSDSGGDVAP